MKIIGLSFSPRSQGNTEILLEEALSSAKREGADAELYSFAGKHIEPCDGCSMCRKSGECRINDDMQVLYQKLTEANGIIFGTPIYYYSMTGQAKVFIDRTIVLGRPGPKSLRNKVGGVVAVGNSLGLINAIKDFYFFIITQQMLPASFVAAYAGSEGEVRQVEKAMNASAALGKQMVQLINKNFTYPGDARPPAIAYRP